MKTWLRKFLALGILVSLCFIYPNMTTANQDQSASHPDDFAARSASSLWDYYFQQHVNKGDDAARIKEVAGRKALDWGRLNFGGTGNYALRFKLDDFMQVEFQFDQASKLRSYRVFRHRELWIKDPDGNILHQSDK